ncbi:MAG: 7-cyano-7-deazaguanine synthase QueC [Deltaproteobacteria bacterium]|nr:7-cyano-7-deazaguanine synthase QueC [Deltaproteobacteria bacterium]
MKTVVCFSGGMDSTVLLYHLIAGGHSVKAISVDYGQRHRKELESAKSISQSLKIDHRILDLAGVGTLLKGSALTDRSVTVPRAEYDEQSLKVTVVPNRNMIFLSIAASWALSSGWDSIAIASHGGDRALYPDCRSEFLDAMRKALNLSDWNNLELLSPFTGLSKAEICKLGSELGVPFEKTWSCYEGGPAHCGSCGTCRERRSAFKECGLLDPAPYHKM